jgi:hypothetical protein
MKTIKVRADEITAGNIIEDACEMCHVLRVKADTSYKSIDVLEFLLMPFGCSNQGALTYSLYPANHELTRYVASEVSK